jgi:hypothetical protein
MKLYTPRGKDGQSLGVGDIVIVWWLSGKSERATILSLEEMIDEREIRIFDSEVLWHTGEKGLASTSTMTLVSKAIRKNVR